MRILSLSDFRHPLRFCCALLLVFIACMAAYASNKNAHVTLYPIPDEVSSSHYKVSVNGHSTDVLHAATGYYLLNFDTNGAVTVSVTAEDPHFWDAGVEVQPMRLGIRPVRHGGTITFPINGPGKLSITRPGDHFADGDMLFLFANPPDTSGITAATPHVRYFGPGAHHENIDAQSGDVIYLAGGAVIFGSLNIWQVHDVRVLGRGTVIYDGPQDPHSDEGWMHKPNWHVIVMDNARNIEIDGITCITRSRSWQIQMKDSRHIGFYNIKVIGGNPNNANQDGMDWLGGGDTTVRNSFFRASDDVFALQGNWDGYDLALMRVPGHDVTNITIEDTVVSTSISNIVRVGWPQKTFNSANFMMSGVDVLHSGYGACKVPFGFFELWADPEGKGTHTGYRFNDIRMDDWYSLFQLRQPAPSVRDISFSDVWAMDGPAMVQSVVKGDVQGVVTHSATLQGYQGAKVKVEEGAAMPSINPATESGFTYTSGLIKPGQPVAFTADQAQAAGLRFEWLFGDGSHMEGREVRHKFPDAQGTLLDGTGRFRVLLHATDAHGMQSWDSQQVVVLTPAVNHTAPIASPTDGSDVFDRVLQIPADGGYTFTLLTSREATLSVDEHVPIQSPKPQLQVCGAEGDAVQALRLSMTLSAGPHRIHIRRMPGLENANLPPGHSNDEVMLLWEGPGIDRQIIPASALSQLEH